MCAALFLAARTCFVSDLQRGLKIQEAKFNLDGTAEVRGVFAALVSFHCFGSSESLDAKKKKKKSKRALNVVRFPEICVTCVSLQRPAPPPDVHYPLDGEKILHVQGSIR